MRPATLQNPNATMQIFVKTRTSLPYVISNSARRSHARKPRRTPVYRFPASLRFVFFRRRSDLALSNPTLAPSNGGSLEARPGSNPPSSPSLFLTQSPARPLPWRWSPRIPSTTSRLRFRTKKVRVLSVTRAKPRRVFRPTIQETGADTPSHVYRTFTTRNLDTFETRAL